MLCRQPKVFVFLSFIVTLQSVHGHRQQRYDEEPEEQQQQQHYKDKPVLKRFLRRTRLPIIYKSGSPSMDSKPAPSAPFYLHQSPSMDTEWRRWASEMAPAVYNNDHQSYEPNYRPLIKSPPLSESRMYFRQYNQHRHPHHHHHPHHSPPSFPNHFDQGDLNNEEPIEIGAGPPPPSMSPSVADLYRDLTRKRGHRHRKPYQPSMHPTMHDYSDMTPYQPESEQYQPESKEVDEDFSPYSLYPNFDDDQNLYGYNNFYKKK
ncbi:hypothetical protein TYRP_021957 [Tyrophagus putrescentiae]|nr:hypothetical protein TYRP_021957 [Tyrophagus putrescentiae]